MLSVAQGMLSFILHRDKGQGQGYGTDEYRLMKFLP